MSQCHLSIFSAESLNAVFYFKTSQVQIWCRYLLCGLYNFKIMTRSICMKRDKMRLMGLNECLWADISQTGLNQSNGHWHQNVGSDGWYEATGSVHVQGVHVGVYMDVGDWERACEKLGVRLWETCAHGSVRGMCDAVYGCVFFNAPCFYCESSGLSCNAL